MNMNNLGKLVSTVIGRPGSCVSSGQGLRRSGVVGVVVVGLALGLLAVGASAPRAEVSPPKAGNGAPVAQKLWATTIPGTAHYSENFGGSALDEFRVDITNPNSVAVRVGVVRYPAYKGDRGVSCSQDIAPYTSRNCLFNLPEAVGLGPVAVVIAAPVPVAVTAMAIWKFHRKDQTGPDEYRPVQEDLMVPVQVQEMK